MNIARKRANQKRAEWFVIIKGVSKKEWKAEAITITDPNEKKYILEVCVSLQCYFRAFGITKTCKMLTVAINFVVMNMWI